ncbi:cell wall-binding repeat-containing protein [Alkalihalobacillus sp. AL-G]|uniref:cell wall-binding repeat-containing protein n=1 Tax=Alkalihalobacillus sp. AL-G TaxID=2926399 RepID=UPI00272AFB67|nr:cell wall-binding repeat-containing protein [Alkalihalobacillus sp. AL-G]WLD93021.1 cell wall-binding repeat-containing protein [Alkalihalobacillus sp. AL-G]
MYRIILSFLMITGLLVSTQNYTYAAGDSQATGDSESINQSIPTLRISGPNRYDTNLAFSSIVCDGCLESVILASGENFPDALSGSVLTKTLQGSILLVEDNEQVLKKMITEAKRILKPDGEVYYLGGPSAISPNVISEFEKHFSVTGIFGKDRTATSLKIASMVDIPPTEVFLVYGGNFADALSIAPVSEKNQIPVLLNNDKETLDPRIEKWLNENSVKDVTIVGGESVVSTKIEKHLEGKGLAVTRIAGKNRFETSLKIAESYYPPEYTQHAALANGYSFADALSGSVFSGEFDIPILLSYKDHLPDGYVPYLNKKDRIYFYGGEAVIYRDILKNGN